MTQVETVRSFLSQLRQEASLRILDKLYREEEVEQQDGSVSRQVRPDKVPDLLWDCSDTLVVVCVSEEEVLGEELVNVDNMVY